MGFLNHIVRISSTLSAMLSSIYIDSLLSLPPFPISSSSIDCIISGRPKISCMNILGIERGASRESKTVSTIIVKNGPTQDCLGSARVDVIIS
jgi:hypothetical protein